MIKVTLPDGSKKEVKSGTTAAEVAALIGKRLAQAALAAKVDGKAVDLSTPLTKDCTLEILTFDTAEGKEVLWHSGAHVMAKAVKELWPHAKLTIGPPIEEGFYYDFDMDRPFSDMDLAEIDEKVKEVVKRNDKFVRVTLSKAEAIKKNEEIGETYKNEIIRDMGKEKPEEKEFSFYQCGGFIDLCRGPHVPSTGYVRAFKVLKASGAYWRGNVKNRQLQRVYAIAFPEEKQLKEFVTRREEAEKRDHHKLGRELGIFMTHEWSLPGSPFLLRNGAVIYNELMKLVREEYLKRGYNEVITPQLFKKKLWETSGHWDHYRENMFTLKIGEEDYAMKAMNCPSHLLIYNQGSHSYKDLPLRIADFCQLHRNELAGVLGGLTRVTKFAQDDAHIFVAPNQIEDEIGRILEMVNYLYRDIFHFTYRVKLSTRPEKSMGDDSQWKHAEASLANALKKRKVDYVINAGDGAFYGPKIDIDIADALGRQWQCATVQLDFQMPLRFGAEFVNEKGQKEPVVIIHRAILGSLERFIGVLIEHYAGAFPTWLSPTQVVILPMTDAQNEHAERLHAKLAMFGVRSTVDSRSEKLEAKIRAAQALKSPYMLVIGKREQDTDTVSVRKRDNEVKQGVSTDAFIANLLREITSRSDRLEAA